MHIMKPLMALCAAACLSTSAMAADFPSGPITMVVPFSAGGSTDILARVVGQSMSEDLDTPVVVENKPGAEGFIGALKLKQAKPDGLTLMMVTTSVYAINEAIFPNVPYESQKDFVTVSMVASSPNVFLAGKDSKFENLKELVAYAKKHPDELNYATGATMHLMNAKWIESEAGVKMVSIPYKGSSAAYPDLLAGRVDFMVDQPLSSMPYINQGRLKVLAVTSAERWHELADVPTVKEQGFPDFVTTSWWAVLAPAGTPENIVRKLNSSITKGLKAPEVQERIKHVGADISDLNLQESQEYTAEEIKKWAKIAKEADVKIE